MRFACRAKLVKARAPSKSFDPKDVMIMNLQEELTNIKKQYSQVSNIISHY